MLGFLFLCNPLESRFATGMEVMNECTVLMQTYLLICFTDVVTEQRIRYNIGTFYIAVSLMNISVHLLILIGVTLKDILFFLRRKYCSNCCRFRLKPKATPTNVRWWASLNKILKFNKKMPRGIEFKVPQSNYLYPIPEID